MQPVPGTELLTIVTDSETDPITGFDIIGDVHGCYEELVALLTMLGYQVDGTPHPCGRRLIFVGDLVDRGPNSRDVVTLVDRLWFTGVAYAVLGNHDWKIFRALRGNAVHLTPEHRRTIEQLTPIAERTAAPFFSVVPTRIAVFTGQELQFVVSHAGIPLDFALDRSLGKHAKRIFAHCLYGEVQPGRDENGFPIRTTKWHESWAGTTGPLCIHGHTVSPTTETPGYPRIINVDQGCCFGGRLTAFQWPERRVVSADSRQPIDGLHLTNVHDE